MAKYINDYGHGGSDPGAGAGGVSEKTFTLDIGKRVNEGLKRHGIIVDTTRDSDVSLNNNVRTNKVKNSKAKVCLSHHINAGGGTGAEVLISKYNDGKLANMILKELEKLGLRNRGAKKRTLNNGQDYYFMHRNTGSITTLIIEYCFIDTKTDRDFLLVKSNRQKMADAVVRAVCNYEGIKYKEAVPKPSSSNKELYKVQVGAYADKTNADKKLAELKKQGHQAYIKKE